MPSFCPKPHPGVVMMPDWIDILQIDSNNKSLTGFLKQMETVKEVDRLIFCSGVLHGLFGEGD